MNGNRDTDGSRDTSEDPAGSLYDAVRLPTPWDLYRGSILKMAEEELATGADMAMTARLDQDLATVWRDSPTALLVSGVAYYKAGKEAKARLEWNEAWEIWEELLDVQDPQTDTPLEIIVLLRDILRLTGLDEGSSQPNHFRIRPAYQWLCQEYRRWQGDGSQWQPTEQAEDPLKNFCITCFRKALKMKDSDRAPLMLDPFWATEPP